MSDCVIIAFEAINLLDKKQYGGKKQYEAIKLILEKHLTL